MPVKLQNLNFAHYFLFLFIGIAFIFCFKMMNIYLDAIIFAIIFAILMNPVYELILKRCRNSRAIAAGISCLLLILVIVVPLSFMGILIIQQGIESISAINQWIQQGNIEKLITMPILSKIIAMIKEQMAGTGIDLSQFDFKSILLTASSHTGKFLVNQGGALFGNVSSIIGKFGIMLFVFFFMIQDQKKNGDIILHLMPLSSKHESMLASRLSGIAKSAFLGTLLTAAAHGAAGGIALAICGIPGFFWGTVMAFASLIPLVGTAFVWVPAAVYLFLSGVVGYGVFLVVWSLVVVGMIDNLLRPMFMKGSADMGTLLIFLSIIGGINYFGLTGLLYGPLIFGVTLVLLTIYELEFKPFLDQQDKT